MPKKKRKSNSPPFVMIEHKILEDEGWLRLGNGAKVAFIYFKQKSFPWKREGFELTYKNMKPVMKREGFSKAIKELEKEGFIERVHHGGLYRGKSRYRMSNNWQRSSRVSEPVPVGNPNPFGLKTDDSGRESEPIWALLTK